MANDVGVIVPERWVVDIRAKYGTFVTKSGACMPLSKIFYSLKEAEVYAASCTEEQAPKIRYFPEEYRLKDADVPF